ncbi:MAG: TadE/TadG family type IV pilus assembly protein [Planctomycetaceae bacterium]
MRQRRKSTRRNGAALVEMALVLPVFLTVVLGIMEFGRAMMVSNLVANAAREGARLSVTTGSTNSTVTSTVQDFMAEAIGVSSGNVTVTITVTAAAGNPDPANDVANASRGDTCTIHVTVPFNAVSLVAADHLAGVNLVGHCAMRHE